MALGARGAARVVVCTALIFAAATVPASAQPHAAASGADEARRTTLYRDGVNAATAGRWADARELFAAALAIRPSPKVYFSLAQTEQHLGDLAAATRDYQSARDGAKAAGETDVVDAAQQALSTLSPPPPPAATTAPPPPPAQGEGAPPPVAPTTAGPGPSPAPPAQESPAATPATPSTWSTWRTVSVAAAGAGVLGLAFGSYFGIEAKSKFDQSNGAGCSGDACTASAASIRREAVSDGNVSTALFVLGGVLVAGGVALWLVAPASSRDDGVHVSLAPLASGGGVFVAGGWR